MHKGCAPPRAHPFFVATGLARNQLAASVFRSPQNQGVTEHYRMILLRVRWERRLRSIGVASISSASDVGSGAELVADAKLPGLALGDTNPKLLRTKERSVRSIVGAPSKFPEVQFEVLAPKWLSTVERSVRSTWPSTLASPRSATVSRMELLSTPTPDLGHPSGDVREAGCQGTRCAPRLIRPRLIPLRKRLKGDAGMTAAGFREALSEEVKGAGK